MSGTEPHPYCGGCGAPRRAGDRFCPACGRQEGQDAPTAATWDERPPVPPAAVVATPAPGRPKGLIAAVVAAGVAVVVVAAAITVVAVRHHHASPAATVKPVATVTPTSPATSPATSGVASGGATHSGGTAVEQAAASRIATVLADDVRARAAVVAATAAVGNCSADPNAEAGQVQGAVVIRQSDLGGLRSMAAADLPNGPAMVADLVSAMQASDQADGDYERWMADVEGDPCPYPTTSDGNFQSASAASTQATAEKIAFTALWNPVAASLGLAQYDQSQI